MHVADGAPRSGTAGAPGICLKMRIRADCLAEMSHNAARRHAGRHALERNREDLVARWVESKNVGGVSEVTLLTSITSGAIARATRPRARGGISMAFGPMPRSTS